MKKVDVQRVGERALEDGSTEVIIRSPELTNSDTIIVTKIANAADGLLVKIAKQDPTSAPVPTASNTRSGE